MNHTSRFFRWLGLALFCCLATPAQAATPYETLASHNVWLNTSRPLTAQDLEGRIILLDFWTYACINCMHVIPDLKYLEEKFGSDLTVIGVHSAKFKNEQDTKNIRSAILRYGIHHPVVNDFDFGIWNAFGVRAWPTFVLIGPKGLIAETYSGEGNREKMETDIRALMKKYNGAWKKETLPIALEENKMAAELLKFPGKIVYDGGVFYLSDTGHNQVIAVDGKTNIATTLAKDFASPQGVLYANGTLYVADTNNHLLRAVDVKTGEVTTLAGTGKQGYERNVKNAPALATPLASPWDLAFYPDEKHIAIAMAGTHQIWSYDIENKTVSVIAGSGREDIIDGKALLSALAQPSGLSAFDGKLYFVDSETSSLRMLENGEVKTLIGTGLFDFGFKDGNKKTALMQHPIGVFADASGVYVADSFNHSIRRYDPQTGQLTTIAGHGARGSKDAIAAEAEFNEPNGIIKIDGKFYVTDTNNHRVRVIDNGAVTTLELSEKKSEPSGTVPLPSSPSKP